MRRFITNPRISVIMDINKNGTANALNESAGLNITSSGGTTVIIYL